MPGFTCGACGQFHDELPLRFGAPAPGPWFDIAPADREQRCLLSSDQCVIDEQRFFMIGNLELPIIGSTEKFSWDTWVELSRADFERAFNLWEQEGRESEPPYEGTFATLLPGYPPTVGLKVRVHTRPVGLRPFIEMLPSDHPLAVEQRDGISLDRIQKLAESILHATG
jgi:hypothetical protein